MRWLALFVALGFGQLAHALDTNDELTLVLDGGEEVRGWFIRGEARLVVLSVAGLSEPSRIPLDIIASAQKNGEAIAMPALEQEVADAHQRMRDWVANPPPHPLPIAVISSSLIVPGAGQAILGQRRDAMGYLIADLVLLGAGAIELIGDQRLGVLVPLVSVDLILRLSSAGDAARTATRRRRKLREAQSILAGPTQR